MVAYQHSIIFFLVIPSGATTGQRIVIDGVNGLIQVFDSNNNLVAQMGQGAGLEVFGDLSTMKLSSFAEPFNNDAAGLQLWLNSAPSNTAAIFMADDGSFRLHSQEWVGTSGHNVQAEVVLASATGGKVVQLAFRDLNTGGTEPNAPFVVLNETANQVAISGATFIAADTSSNNSLIRNGSETPPWPVYVRNGDNWITLTLLNGWTPSTLAGYFQGLRVRKDIAGVVWLNGSVVAPATGTPPSVMAQLPTGFTPSAKLIFTLFYSANSPKLSDVQINAPNTPTNPSAVQFGTDFGTTAGGTAILSCQWPAEF